MMEKVTEASGEGIEVRSYAQESRNREPERNEGTWLEDESLSRTRSGGAGNRINNHADKKGVGVGKREGKIDRSAYLAIQL